MKTILTIFALTLGFTGYAQAIEMPLIGLPVKASTASPVVKKVQAAQVKMRALGMGGGGIPYLCTGTKYECGLTGDPADVSPVVNADTGLRDIVKATGLYALDSSGNLYRRMTKVWSTRPVGNVGELVARAGGSDGLNFPFAMPTVCNAATGAQGSTCKMPAVLTGNDWALADTNVISFFGGIHNGPHIYDAMTGWVKADGVRYMAGNPNYGIQKPAVYGLSEAIAASADTGAIQGVSGNVGKGGAANGCDVNSGVISTCYAMNGPNPFEALDTPRTLEMQVPVSGLFPGSQLFALNSSDNYFMQPDGARRSVIFSQGFNNSAAAELLANKLNYTFSCSRTYDYSLNRWNPCDNGRVAIDDNKMPFDVPGTGSIVRIYGVPDLNSVNDAGLILETSTHEFWRFTAAVPIWTKL